VTGNEFVAEIPGTLQGVRVDRAVALLTGVARSTAAGLVASGDVLIDGRVVTSRREPLSAGTELAVRLPPETPRVLAPDPDVVFDVVYDDDQLVVVDKPPGVVVHPGAGHRSGTLVAGLLARFPDIASLGPPVCDPERPGIVHRIDRGTSGLLVVARTPEAFRSLAAQMAQHSVGRRYVTLVAGRVDEDEGWVDAPIGRSQRSPTRMAVSAGGREAQTGYVVVDRLDGLVGRTGAVDVPATLLVCTLTTGRTHQIRVHMAAIGHPVIGDERYGRPPAGIVPAGRTFLHASSLAIDHPVTGRRMEWTSPLPEDLLEVLGAAGSRLDAAVRDVGSGGGGTVPGHPSK
jgi:23S rRNA pseudouridine1911/1915/1917 synthase